MIQVDSYYTSSQRPRKNSQDFALSGLEPIPYTILCDGCSSSKNSDVGARLLAFSAKKSIGDILKPVLETLPTDMEELYKLFGLRSIIDAWKAACSLFLNIECLDSTLILEFYKNKKVYCFVYGDGTIIDPLWTRKVSFEGNAPFYLSYLMDPDRLKAYKRFADGFDGFTKKVSMMGSRIDNKLKFDSPVIFEIEDKHLVLVSTDGIDSFIDFNTVEKIPSSEAEVEFLSLKNTKEEFIKRRVSRAVEDFNKRNIFLTDDLSVGGILIE